MIMSIIAKIRKRKSVIQEMIGIYRFKRMRMKYLSANIVLISIFADKGSVCLYEEIEDLQDRLDCASKTKGLKQVKECLE